MGEWKSQYATDEGPHPAFTVAGGAKQEWKPTAEDPTCKFCGAPKHRHLGGRLCDRKVGDWSSTAADSK